MTETIETTEAKLVLRNRIIGLLLRNARERAEKTKRECAAALGVSTGTITAYEEGRKPISLPELEVLAYVTDTPTAHFWEHGPELVAEEEPVQLEEILALRHRIVGALLRQARLEADKTQKELAGRSTGLLIQPYFVLRVWEATDPTGRIRAIGATSESTPGTLSR